ncbi:MAG: YegS/Rv2252/BmrU family lipid kinase [Clostridiales bacterium]|nr:YegS/Rv2252/BmrU family lipid kinase [Clostridiales bacterium]
MKKLKLIYNPFSGNKCFKFDLDVCIRIFQEGGFEVHVFRSIKKGDIEDHISQMSPDYDVIVVSGGDGTVNLAVNGLMKRGLKIPLGIIPSGTANDFASFLNLNIQDLENCCRIITETSPKMIDIGKANQRYFINVCGGGLLANISNKIDNDFKNALGTLAYYIKGIEAIPNFSPIPIRITNSKEVIEDDVYLFLVLNSAGAGSFNMLAPFASVSDGYFDFIGIKAKPVYEIAVLFLKILRGEHIGDPNVIYFRDKYIKLECLMKDPKQFSHLDLDGEDGPDMPVEIDLIHHALPVFLNK